MSAPVAILPLADNEARPPRLPVFQTRAFAESHAIRCARVLSATQTVDAFDGAPGLFRATEGGPAFLAESTAGLGEFVVRPVLEPEFSRLVQAGLRSAIAQCLEKAAAWELRAGTLRPGAVHAEHVRWAREERDRARELETKLTVAAVPAPMVTPCCTYGATKGGTKAAPCWSCADEASNRSLPRDYRRD